jgi:hypothetical protein
MEKECSLPLRRNVWVRKEIQIEETHSPSPSLQTQKEETQKTINPSASS